MPPTTELITGLRAAVPLRSASGDAAETTRDYSLRLAIRSSWNRRGRRAEILTRLAEELFRQGCRDCRYEISDRSLHVVRGKRSWLVD